MKTAIYVENGVTQIVLMPTTAFEREILARIAREEFVHVRVAKNRFLRPDPEAERERLGAADAARGDPPAHEQGLRLSLGAATGEGAAAEGFRLESFAGDLPLPRNGGPQSYRPRDY